MTSFDCRTTARPSSAGMIPTLRTPASASPSGPSAMTGRLTAPNTSTAPVAITASLLKSRIASLPDFVCWFALVKQTKFILRRFVSLPLQETQRSPSHIDVLHLRVTDDFIEALFFADSTLFPSAIGRADITAAGIDPDVARFDAFRCLHGLREVVSD